MGGVTSVGVLSGAWIGAQGASVSAAISKFRAPSLTRPVALEVGVKQFDNHFRIEAGLAVILTGAVAMNHGLSARGIVPLVGALGALTHQRLVLFPQLESRQQAICDGKTPNSATDGAHVQFRNTEFFKLACLASMVVL